MPAYTEMVQKKAVEYKHYIIGLAFESYLEGYDRSIQPKIF